MHSGEWRLLLHALTVAVAVFFFGLLIGGGTQSNTRLHINKPKMTKGQLEGWQEAAAKPVALFIIDSIMRPKCGAKLAKGAWCATIGPMTLQSVARTGGREAVAAAVATAAEEAAETASLLTATDKRQRL